jgi:hypothetical protein
MNDAVQEAVLRIHETLVRIRMIEGSGSVSLTNGSGSESATMARGLRRHFRARARGDK